MIASKFFSNRRQYRPLLLAAGVASLLGMGSVAQAFEPDETQVSLKSQPMPDIEFDRTNFQVSWEDKQQRLWVTNVSQVDGSFDMANALQLDSGLAPLNGYQNGTGTGNGPEWLFTDGNSQILYTKQLGPERGDLEVYRAVEDNGVWTVGPFADADGLPFGRKGFVPIGNTRTGDADPSFCFYRDNPGANVPTLAWRKLNSAIGSIVDIEPAGIARWASGASNLLAYPKQAPDGSKQIYLFNTSNLTSTQLTFSPSRKSDCWLFNVPELGGEQVLATLERTNDPRPKIVIYRNRGGNWTEYNTIQPPSTLDDIDSPEPCVYNGVSYMFCVAVKSKGKPSEIWLLSIMPDKPFARMVSDPKVELARLDPEYLATPDELFIYFAEVGRGNIFRCKTGMGPQASNIIRGTSGKDTLAGQALDDYITGGAGADALVGGQGRDQFAYEHVDDKGDVIADFVVGEDLINMAFLTNEIGYTGTNPLADGYVECRGRNGNSEIWIDPDGPGGDNAFPYIKLPGVKVNALSNKDNFVF